MDRWCGTGSGSFGGRGRETVLTVLQLCLRGRGAVAGGVGDVASSSSARRRLTVIRGAGRPRRPRAAAERGRWGGKNTTATTKSLYSPPRLCHRW